MSECDILGYAASASNPFVHRHTTIERLLSKDVIVLITMVLADMCNDF